MELNDLLFCGRVFILLSKKRMFLHQKWLERWKKDEMSILWRRRYQGDRFKVLLMKGVPSADADSVINAGNVFTTYEKSGSNPSCCD